MAATRLRVASVVLLATLASLGAAAAASPGPTAAFTPPGQPQPTHAAVQFADASLPGDQPIVAVAWDFGDGITSNESAPAHRYDFPGTYNVTLTVTDAAAANDTVVEPVEIVAAPLNASFAASGLHAIVNGTLAFTDTSVGGNGTLTANWTFGDGGNATGASVTHAWAAPGTYTVALNVTDGDGASSRLAANVTVAQGHRASGDVNALTGLDVALPGVDVHFGTSGAGGAVDMLLQAAASLALLAPNVPPVAGGPYAAHGLLYVEGLPGPLHDLAHVDRITLSFHYTALGATAATAAILYWDGTAWHRIPNGVGAPLTIPAPEDPEGNQIVYSVTYPAPGIIAVTLRHASLFAFASQALAGGGGGAPAASNAPPAAAPAAPAAPVPTAPAPGNPAPAPAAPAATEPIPPEGTLELRAAADGKALAHGATASAPLVVHWAARQGDAGAVTVWAVRPDGTRQRLGNGTADLAWDPTGLRNGVHSLEARAGAAVLDRFPVRVFVAQSTPQRIAAGAAAALVVMLAVSAIQAVGASLLAVLQDAGRESVQSLAEERYGDATARRGVRWARLLKPTSVVALLLAGAVVAALFALQGGWGGWHAFAAGLLAAGLPTGVVFLCAYGLDWLVAKAAGSRPRLEFVFSGALALAVSTLGFQTPFGNPGSVEEDEAEGEASEGEGAKPRRPFPWGAAASLLGALAFLAPLWLLDRLGWTAVAEVGVAAALSVVATSAIPLWPMDGSELWHWRKLAALGVFAAALALYVGHTLALVSPDALGAAGLAGLLGFAACMAWLGAAHRQPAPPWFAALARGGWSVATAMGRLVPGPIRRALLRVSQAWDRTQGRAAHALRRSIRSLVRRVHPAARKAA